MQTLAEVQRRLWQLISAPDGVAAALAAEGDDAARSLADWVVDDAQLDAVRRLEVYANAYFQRIHDCLARDFGALAAVVGEAGFHDLVTAYLIAHPSRHPSLRHAGAALPDYLARADAASPFRRRWPWAADLARFEWALGCAFDAGDAEPLTRDALAKLAPQDWGDLVVRFRPPVTLIETDWPVDELFAAWSADRELHAPAPRRAGMLCIWRHDERVRHRAPDPLEASLLRAARAGASFGELCALAARKIGEQDAPAEAARALGRWVDDALVQADSVAPRERDPS